MSVYTKIIKLFLILTILLQIAIGQTMFSTVAAASESSAGVSSDNLLLNGGFQEYAGEQINDWNTYISTTAGTGTVTSVTYAVYQPPSTTPDNRVVVVAASGLPAWDNASLWQQVEIGPGNYVLSGQAKVAALDKAVAQFSVRFFDQQNNYLTQYDTYIEDQTEEYVHFEQNKPIPANAKYAEVRVYLVANGMNGAGIFYVDDLSLAYAPEVKLLTNGDLEQSSGKVMPGWAQGMSPGVTANITSVSAPVRSGNKAAKIEAGGMEAWSSAYLVQTAQISGGSDYRLSGYLNIPLLNQAVVELKVHYLNGNHQYLSQDAVPLRGTTDGYIPVELVKRTPSAAAYVEVVINLYAEQSGASGTVYADDLTLGYATEVPMLVNGNLEQAAGSTILGWNTYVSGTASGSVASTTYGAFEGTRAVKVEASGLSAWDNASLWQQVEIGPGNYMLSGQAKVVALDKAVVQFSVRFFDEHHTYLTQYDTYIQDQTEDYVHFEQNKPIPANAKYAEVRAYLVANEMNGAGTFYIDDLLLAYAPEVKLLTNGDFEQSSGKVMLGWAQGISPGVTASITSVNTPVRGGSKAAKIEAGSMEAWSSAYLVQTVEIAESTDYRLSGHLNVASLNQAVVELKVHYLDGNHQYLSQDAIPLRGTTDGYVLAQLTRTTPEGTAFAEVIVNLYAEQSGASGVIYADDMRLVYADSSLEQDNVPPSAPQLLKAKLLPNREVSLSWEASTDNEGVAGYDIYQVSASASTVLESVYGEVTEHTVRGLLPDTEYRFAVKARDQAGNVSEMSNEVNIRTAPRINVALNKSTQTDGACSPSETGDKAVDGILTENSKWCSLGSEAHWLIVDLDRDTYVGEFVVKHAGSGGEGVEDNTQDFTIELSEDGEQWTTVVNVTGNTSSETTHPIESMKARYAKLLITVPTARQDDAARIYEFEVYGEPADQEAPTAPTGLTVTGRSLNSVNLAWLDSTDNIEVTGYDIYQGTTKVDTVQAGITAYTVTGLMADMAYRFTVKARDEEGNVSEASNEVKIRTSPRINVALNKSTQTDGSCSPSEAGDKAVDGTLTENSKWCSFGSEAHWLIVDLGEDTYVGEFVVKHAGSGGESTEDNTQDFTIQLSQDAEQWTTAVNVTGNTSSETTHPIASTKARYAKLLITVPTARQDDAARIYEFEVYGEPADQEAPAAPAGLTVTGRSLNSVKLAWLASNDNIGVTGYDIYQGATQVGTVQAGITAYTVTGLTADTAYRFTVKARDGEGNVSEASDEVELRTSPRINAALNKSTQTDGFCSPSEAGDKAVDGTLTENSKWCSFGSGAHWLIVDLGIETYVGEFVVKHAGSGGEGVLDNTQDFTIELSEDGEQWTTVVNVTGNTSSETTHPIASTKARYAKLLITVPTARQDDAARIYEFEVYGEPADQEAPATPLGLTVTGRNLNSVNLAWLASTDNIGVTSYDIYQGATQVGTVQAGVTAYTVTGLASDTAYRFTVKARDGEGNVSEASNEVEIRTSPRINVALNQSTQTDGFCSPSEAGDKAVDGTLTENSKWCSFGSGAHWLIVDLGIDTYVGEFAVKHAGSGGESVEDNTQDFTIELSEDGEQWITVVNVTGNTLNETTHPIASTKARYAKLLITVPTARQDDAARIYEFEVYGEPTDQEAPTAPTGLTVTGRNLNSVDLAWSPSTDNVGVKEYAIYQNNVWITSVGADRTSYMVSGLEANTNYEFAVTAIDKAGNESTKSNAVALVIDTEAPTIPTNLVLLERTSTSIKLQWTASLDNIGIASYEIYDSSILLASIDGSLNSYTVTNLEDNKNYAFTVRAKDAEGNLSEVSNAAILIENTPPSAPTLTLSNPDWSKENVTVTIIPGTDPSGIQSTEYRIGTDVMWSTYVESIVVTATGTTTLYARSIDNAGNISSEASAVVKIDKTKPSAPQNLYYQKSSSTSGQLYWAASTDNEYVAGYDIYNGETWIASTQATSYSFTGLNPNAHYFFIVKAKDIAGNVSEAGILSTPSSFWIANNTNARVSLQWEYEPDCWCNYEVYLNGEFIAEVFYYFYEIRDLQPGTSYAISVKRVVWDDNGDPNYTEMGTLDVITNSKPPTIPQNLALGTRTETSISLSWTASTDDIGVTSYDIYNGSTFLGTSLTTNYTVTPLDADTIYVFSVRAKDASGNVSEPSGSVAFDHIPPSAPSGLSVITPTKTSVSLGWTASTDNLKVTSYDVYNGSTFIGSTSTNSYTFIPLSTDTNYEFLVKARDAGGNVSSFSNSVVFNTSNITLSASFWITDISLTSVQLGWEEEPNACCGYLIYLDGVYLDYVEITGGLQYYEIPNLQPGRKYLIIITKDVWEENTGWNYIEDRGDVLVTTDTDSSPPTAPTQLIVDSHTATSVSLSWTASTDNTGVSGYDIYNISTLVGTTTTTNYTFTTLEANSIYLFSVRARDTSGNVSPYSNLVFFTTINSPPTAPANLTITSKTATSVSLSWTASTDNKGVTGYAIYNGNTYLGTSQNGTNYTVTGLTELTTYSFTVKAMDEDGNFSPASNTAIVTTLDATPPSAPTNLAVTGRTPTSVSLSWTASTDNKGVTGYAIYNENTYLGTSQTATNYTVTGLTELATYSFYVVAMDAAGNRSPASNIVITTLDETYSSAPTNLAVTVLTATSVSLTWTGPTDNSGLVSYLIYNGDTYVGTSQSATRFTLTGLTEHTSYTFKVKAIDAAGNLSPASNIVTVVIQTGTPVQYYYDASGRVDYIQLQSGQRLKYYFDANGNLLNVVLQD